MPRRDDLTDLLIVGATAGLFAAGTNIAARYTPEPADVLGFVGGAIGAGAAVAGSRWIEAAKRREAVAEYRRYLAEMLLLVWSNCETLTTVAAEGYLPRLLAVVQSVEGFLAMSGTAIVTDPDLHGWLLGIRYWYGRALREFERGVTDLETADARRAEVVARLRPHVALTARATAATLLAPAGWPDVGQHDRLKDVDLAAADHATG